MVGPEHVLGLAIGNELELLHNHVGSGQRGGSGAPGDVLSK